MKEFIKQVLREDFNNKKKYLGQCDLLRHKSQENEEYWHIMMANKKKITFKSFVDSVEIHSILDDDENPKEYISNLVRSDDETAAYISKWGDRECMFIQTAGFEFIFV